MKRDAYYAQNRPAEKGQASGRLLLALDETPGTWKIRVKDVASGVQTEERFVLR